MSDTVLAKLKKRDSQAQEQFRRRIRPKIYAICMHILADPVRAEDSCEDILMDFFDKHVDKVRDDRALNAYLRMMTVRACVRIRHWLQRHEAVDQQDPFISDNMEDSCIESIDSMVTQAKLTKCLAHLTEKAQKVFVLRYQQEMTQEDIGDKVGASKQYINRLLKKGLESLRRCMEAS
jgi:RNA polymerase sigma factor (sigma-70 family)